MSVGKIILICLAGLSLNLLGSLVVEIFDLPLYLDTSGTIFIAMLGGYMPGIAVGFFTNLIKAFFEPAQMYFCSISVLVAIISAFFAQKTWNKTFGHMFLFMLALTFVTGTGDLLIEGFLRAANIFEPIKDMDLNFGEDFFEEFFDKALSVTVAFVLLRFTPSHVKKNFLRLGRRQAPLTDEMNRVVHEQNYLSSSLRTKMLLILTASSLLLSFSIALISYLLFKDTAVDEKIKTVDGMVTVIVSEINPYSVDNFIKYGRNAIGYRETEEKLYAIKNSSVDARFLYVYRFDVNGCRVVFDLNTATEQGDKPGQVIEPEASVLPYMNDLIAGKPIPPIITDDKYGYLLTLYKPVYDAAGKCQCYAALDFSMDMLIDYTRTFIIKLVTLFAGCFVLIFVIGLNFIENNIILPVNTMAYCARNFSYDSETARERNIERIKSLQISTGDEIENLYSALIKTTENILHYLERLRRAKVLVAEMDELAHTDSLTGIKNKTAYTETIARLDKKILSAHANFCIVMVDVNYLKRVNDTYGHERGNEYLINACKLVCAVFGTEHVYRIGGDEFVVIIEGEKVSLCKYFVAQFKFEMERKIFNAELAPWEKISAAVGVAHYEPVHDKTADEVFKRADEQMYANKLAMKAARTD